MENNKTAMQEMLEWVRKTFPMDLDTPRMIEAKIESLLPKEKEQIKTAFSLNYDYPDKMAASERYYQRKYGNGK